MRVFNELGQPVGRDYIPGEVLPDGWSILPFFPGYEYKQVDISKDPEHPKMVWKSIYRGIEVGEGGYVYAEPGIYHNVALLDIASMHPSSIRAECLFGPYYTKRFVDILETRIAIKHGDFEKARSMFGGKLAPYLEDESKAKELANAFKIFINSAYGLTDQQAEPGKENPFRDPRNIDNIVAKRGALFMVNLMYEVQKRGYTVAHIKTDSIKIPDADESIISFVMDYGKEYGYNFEHEATYDRMCLINDAVYIAKYKGGKHDGEWTATGTRFQVPYVFKTLFSHEPIIFSDLCEMKTIQSEGAIYLDKDENLAEGEHDYQFIGRVGLFTPVVEGYGGGRLVRRWTKDMPDGTTKDCEAAIVGTKKKDGTFYRWRESPDMENKSFRNIDLSYYDAQVDEAKEKISQYGDFEEFVS